MTIILLIFPVATQNIVFVSPRTYPLQFGQKITQLMPLLTSTAECRPVFTAEIRAKTNIKELFANMPWDDAWHDAGMPAVVQYLKGNRHLRIPEDWKPYLPSALPD